MSKLKKNLNIKCYFGYGDIQDLNPGKNDLKISINKGKTYTYPEFLAEMKQKFSRGKMFLQIKWGC